MDDLPLPAVCMLSVLGVASVLVLSLAVYRLWHRIPILPGTSESLPTVHWISVVIVLSSLAQSFVLMLFGTRNTGPTRIDLVQIGCSTSILIFVAILLPMTYQGGPNVDALGFHLKKWRQQVSDGVLGFAASVLPVGVVWYMVSPWKTAANSHGLLQLLMEDRSASTLLWITLSAVIVAPVLEELVYRVVLQTWLQQVASPREALIVVAIIFAAVHRFPDAIPLLPLALVLGYVYQQRRCFLSVVLIHMLFNAANLTFLLMTVPSQATP